MSDERAHGDSQKIFKNSTDSQLPIAINHNSQFEIENDENGNPYWLVVPRELRQASRQKDAFEMPTPVAPPEAWIRARQQQRKGFPGH